MYDLENDTLRIQGIPVEDIARQYGTPLYVYNLQTIGERTNELQTNLGGGNVLFLYAIKANYNPEIVRFIVGRGFGVDAVSIEEVKMALHCGVPLEKIMLTENNIGDDEMDEAFSLGVLLNVGSLARLEKFGRAHPGTEVCIRFNPDIGAASHATNMTGGPDSKFGIPHEHIDRVLEIAGKHGLKIVGVHEHIGSGWLSSREPAWAMDVLLGIARRIPGLKFIDAGGGFGVAYSPEEARLDLKKLGQIYKRKFENFCREYGANLQLRFEPGRYVVAEAGHLLARVTDIKESSNGKIFAGLDTGMNHLIRPAFYGSYHPITNISNPNGRMRRYEVCGNVCECADFFARGREMPELREGDLVSIDIVGAYGISMGGNYQLRPLPAEVLVENGKVRVIRRRQTFEDILAGFAE